MPEVMKPWLSENADCQVCRGSRNVVVMENGVRFAKECVCVPRVRVDRYLREANLPDDGAMSLLKWDREKGRSESQKIAFHVAEDFAKQHPAVNNTKGLIFTGKVGIGKTHLAIGVLRAMIMNHQCSGIYYRQGALLDLIKSSFDDEHLSETDILKPLRTRTIVVLDDVGTSKPTEWVVEKMLEILAERYEKKLTTIITTNYPVIKTIRGEGELKDGRGVGGVDVLGDRIGNRATSRLSEMCMVVNMTGEDLRFSSKKAERL
jgi:DNA replication protein DnaC